MRQVVDWSAALWAGLISGVILLLLNVFLIPYFIGGNPWVMVRLFGSVLLGEAVLAPPATFHLAALVVTVLEHLVLSIVFSVLLAYIIHRGGLITGIVGGALFGLLLYLINFYTLTLIFPWFFAMRNWVFVLNHIIFGALSGSIYELLEVEEFVPMQKD
jgi:hypothetical protein